MQALQREGLTMAKKLGYTWYPKDFISDPDVMFMSAAERGVYRDLLDLAYTNENTITYPVEMLARYTNSDTETVLAVLHKKGLEIEAGWTIPSCDKRMELSRLNSERGKQGGAPKGNQNAKTSPKQAVGSKAKQAKGSLKSSQVEREKEGEMKAEREGESEGTVAPTQAVVLSGKQPVENLKKNCANHSAWLQQIGLKNALTPEVVMDWFEAFVLHLGASGKTEETEQEFKRYCASWIASEVRLGRTPITQAPPKQREKINATTAMQQALIKKYGK